MNKLAYNLKELRTAYDMTQSDVAEKVFVTRQAVSKWERGESVPDIDTLIALSALYSVRVDDMLKSDCVEAHTEVAAEIKERAVKIERSDELRSLHRRELVKSMLLWAFALTGIYSLVCGIVQTALYSLSPSVWLIWFTLPVVPPLIFAIRFRHEIGTPYLMFFFDVPFVSGIIFEIIVLKGNGNGAWIAFMLIPAYYLIAVFVCLSAIRKQKRIASADIKSD